jgi:nucleotide-binding universal stress UspA family protein
MTIKHILLPLTGDPTGEAAAVCGLTLAKKIGAHVTAGYEDEMGPTYLTPDFMGAAGIASEFYEEVEKARHNRQRKARTFFDRAVRETCLPIVSAPICKQGSTMWLDEDGNDAPVASFGALTDLVVFEAPGKRISPGAWNIVDDALFGARRPTLVVPPKAKSVDMSTVLIAWNGSSEAANAVEHALDLLPADAKIFVLQVGELKPGRMSAERLIEYLGWHCYRAEFLQVPDQEHKTSEIIVDAARRVGAGLLIVGAYTHSRMRELMLGGVTDFMLREAPLPLLMAH